MKQRSFLIGICAGITILSLLSRPAHAQLVSACQPSARVLFPTYADSTPGWSPTESFANATNQLVVGDIDGDGYDELIALPNGQNRVEVWRWSYTTWTPMSKFPSSLIAANLAGGTATQLHLADVDGDGREELIIYVVGPPSGIDQEQTYKYDPFLAEWSLINIYGSGKADGQSYWFKAKPGDKQDTRLRFAATFMDVKRLQGSSWVSVAGDKSPIDRSSIAKCGTGLCVAVSDLDGNGFADLVYLASNAHVNMILTPSSGQYFTASPKVSAVQALPWLGGYVAPDTWRMGDIDGDGKDELMFLTTSHVVISGSPADVPAFGAYYFDTSKMDFAAYPDSQGLLFTQTEATRFSSAPAFGSLTILPKAIGGNMRGAVVLGNTSFLIQFQNNGGTRSVSNLVPLEKTLSPHGELGQPGYYGYLRLAVEPVGTVMLARGPNGVLSEIEGRSGSASVFVDPNSYTDGGYPELIGTAQTIAYNYIGSHATGNNPDIRSLYPDPAAPWAAIRQNVVNMAVPAAPAGIAASDWVTAFDAVRSQTLSEITAIEAVNEFFGVTARLLTDTYLVKDATLEQVTDVLNLPGQPDVSSAIIGEITTALNALGSAFYTFQGALILPNIAERVQNVSGAYGAMATALGTITGDTAEYTASSAPDFSTGKYNLKLSIDNNELGALTANTCHQLQSLSSWDQAKPLADSITSGLIGLDLETQQDLLQITQNVFALDVWQTLAPQVWDIAAVTKFGGGLFPGNANYPSTYVVNANCSDTSVGGSNSTATSPTSLVLEDAATNNFPNLTSLDALFKAPPDGLGAIPKALLLQQAGWSFPRVSSFNLVFSANTGLSPEACDKGITPAIAPVSDFASPALIEASPAVIDSLPSTRIRRADFGSAGRQALAGLAQLTADLKANLKDPKLQDLVTTDLDVATASLQHALQFQQEPKETLRLLNDVLTRLQIHADHDEADREASTAGLVQAVRVRDLLLNTDSQEGPKQQQ